MNIYRLALFTFASLLPVSSLLTACALNQGESFSLGGTNWVLVSLAGNQVPSDVYISASFAGDGSIGGSSGCNSYSAQYEVDDDKITIGPGATTLMACPEPVMEQEMAYLQALGSAASYKLDGENLVLLDEKGEAALVFEPQEEVELEGTKWEVISYNNGRGGVVSVIIGTELTAEFGGDGTLNGAAGCNNYTASYEVNGENINIGPAGATRKFCPEPEGVMEQEAAYLAALETADRFEIENDRMDMYTEEGSRVGTLKLIP
jgi:heat shock protein HslJ